MGVCGVLVKIGKPFFIVAKAGVKWAKNGFPIADKQLLDSRERICALCEYWSSNAYAGLGKCTVCGCTKYKLKLQTEKCPKGKW